MTTTVKNLVPTKRLELAQTTQYTAILATGIIDHATATNITGANVSLNVNLVPSGDNAGSDNLIMDAQTITPGECYPCPELVGHVLENGEFISTLTTAGNAIVFKVTGREIT